MELNPLLPYLFSASVIANIVLVVCYIIYGPRKPTSSDEVEKVMLDIAEALQYKLVVVNLDISTKDEIDVYGFCRPDKVTRLIEIINATNTTPESKKPGPE